MWISEGNSITFFNTVLPKNAAQLQCTFTYSKKKKETEETEEMVKTSVSRDNNDIFE